MKHVFAFSGPIGSGKSSVSKLFAAKILAAWNSFGTTVKEVAEERGLATDRESLQRLGAMLVKEDRNSFCRRVVTKATNDKDRAIVIDGLRHIDVLKELRVVVSPKELMCVYVDTPRTIRLERLKTRDGLADNQVADLERHSTEIEVEQGLKAVADFVSDNSQSVEQCVDTIVQWVKKRELA
jgi:dephospho-CoA kinase